MLITPPASTDTLMNRKHERVATSPGGAQASLADTHIEPGGPSRKLASSKLSSLVSITIPVPFCTALGGCEIVAMGKGVIVGVSSGLEMSPGTPRTVHTSMVEVEATPELTAAM